MGNISRIFRVDILGIKHDVTLLPKDFYFADWQMFDKVTAGNQVLKDQMIVGAVKRKLNGNVVKINKTDENKQYKIFKNIEENFIAMTGYALKDHIKDFFHLFDLISSFLNYKKRDVLNQDTLKAKDNEVYNKLYKLKRDINLEEDSFESVLSYVSAGAYKLGYIPRKWQDNDTYLSYIRYADSNI